MASIENPSDAQDGSPKSPAPEGTKDDPEPEAVMIVGLGGSAGSISALKRFFSAMPADSGMAFVVIVHLSAEHESSLPELLQRNTSMRVVAVTDQVKVDPNCVYVIPPGKQLVSADDHLGLANLQHEHGRRVTIDLFFRTLADTHGPNSAAIVLSGADADGALGLKRVKERGGLTIAQDPSDAEHPSMPRAAIETGMVDLVLQPAEIPARLQAYHRNGEHLVLPAEAGPQPATVTRLSPTSAGEAALRDVLAFLHSRTGRDFSYYKRATILRRLRRRMQINNTETLPAYLNFLRETPPEAGALLKEFLISVTNFFRDREGFDALREQLPNLLRGKRRPDTVRAWSVACATGEEAYSLAIMLDDFARTLPEPPGIQIFATDLAEDAIKIAREGLYPETIAADVSKDHLARYFVKEHGGYRVCREIRETILFAHHDLLKDSPFSRLDVVSCRNLLIYLNRDAQSRAFDIFNFALRPEGLLFLGSSESAEDVGDSFGVVDKRSRIYVAKPVRRLGYPVPGGQGKIAVAQMAKDDGLRPKGELPATSDPVPQPDVATEPREPALPSMSELHYRLLERIAAPSVLVDKEHQIVHLSSTAGRFLRFSGGEPTRDLLRLVDPAMRIELRAALYRVAQRGSSAETFHVPLELDGTRIGVDVSVSAPTDLAENLFVVLFQPRETYPTVLRKRDVAQEGLVHHLERENESLKANLRDVMQQSEASDEELKARNEELQAVNEEMRSASEELETSREELQSINEELTTVNQELKHKIDELGRANSDLQNLIASTSIATVFLDRRLHITRYTPAAVRLFNFIPTDVGRPLSDLTRQRDYGEIQEDAARALSDLTLAQRELQIDGRWYLARTLPYRTIDDHIAGVVLTFFDITDRKAAEDALHAAGQELNTRVKERTEELANANESLRVEIDYRVQAQAERQDMVRQLMAAQEGERARISRGLHDEIGQMLASLLLELKALQSTVKSAEAATKLKAMAGVVEKLSRQTHDLAVELRPTSLDDLGLVRALGNYVEQWSARTGIAAEFSSSGLENSRLPASVETTIYRIVSEALANVSKHAQATKVSVVVQRHLGQAVAVVEDNGVGFDAQMIQAEHKLGVLGMKERAALHDGELIIESEPGRGTAVHVRIPVDTQLADDALRSEQQSK